MTEEVRVPRRGLLFVISGPSGAGKGTLRELLMKKHPELRHCVSVTTRKPRPGEIPGVSYIFTDPRDFESRLARGEFIETANVYGNLYGTPREPVETLLAQGCDVILEKDTQGALSIDKEMPEAILIFIAPPSVDELRARIEKRGTETPADAMCRLSWAEHELKQIKHFDYVVVNYEVEQSVEALRAIIIAERHRVKNQGAVLSELVKETQGHDVVSTP